MSETFVLIKAIRIYSFFIRCHLISLSTFGCFPFFVRKTSYYCKTLLLSPLITQSQETGFKEHRFNIVSGFTFSHFYHLYYRLDGRDTSKAAMTLASINVVF